MRVHTYLATLCTVEATPASLAGSTSLFPLPPTGRERAGWKQTSRVCSPSPFRRAADRRARGMRREGAWKRQKHARLRRAIGLNPPHRHPRRQRGEDAGARIPCNPLQSARRGRQRPAPPGRMHRWPRKRQRENREAQASEQYAFASPSAAVPPQINRTRAGHAELKGRLASKDTALTVCSTEPAAGVA